MQKLICVLALIAGVAAPASARFQKPAVQTEQFAVDICTTTSISVSSSVVTDVLGTSIALGSATVLDVYNQSASTGLACGFDSSVSSNTALPNYGREIWQKTAIRLFADLDKVLHFYCISEGLTAYTATVTKCR